MWVSWGVARWVVVGPTAGRARVCRPRGLALPADRAVPGLGLGPGMGDARAVLVGCCSAFWCSRSRCGWRARHWTSEDPTPRCLGMCSTRRPNTSSGRGDAGRSAETGDGPERQRLCVGSTECFLPPPRRGGEVLLRTLPGRAAQSATCWRVPAGRGAGSRGGRVRASGLAARETRRAL